MTSRWRVSLAGNSGEMPANDVWGAVMDMVVWLRSLGLGRYEAAFRENEIDETVLPSLTHETLKELGVTAVGHRLKLLDAIAVLRADASLKAPLSPVNPHPLRSQLLHPSLKLLANGDISQ